MAAASDSTMLRSCTSGAAAASSARCASVGGPSITPAAAR